MSNANEASGFDAVVADDGSLIVAPTDAGRLHLRPGDHVRLAPVTGEAKRPPFG